MARNDLLGSLGFLVLKTLSQTGPLHGYGIVLHIQRASDNYCALRKVLSTQPCTAWNRVDGSARNRYHGDEQKAKYYKLTAVGKKGIAASRKEF